MNSRKSKESPLQLIADYFVVGEKNPLERILNRAEKGRSSACAPTMALASVRGRGGGEVALAVVYLIRGGISLDFDFEEVELAVGGGRGEG